MSNNGSVGQWLSVNQSADQASYQRDVQHGTVLSPRAPDEEDKSTTGVLMSASLPAAQTTAALPPGTSAGSGRRWRRRRGGGRRRQDRTSARRRPVSRDDLLAAGHPLAPDNTTDFLMNDHNVTTDSPPVVFDRYGWPTPVHNAGTPPPSLDGDYDQCLHNNDHNASHSSAVYYDQQHWSPHGVVNDGDYDCVSTLVAQHVAMERSIEQIEERLRVLRERRSSSDDGTAVSSSDECDMLDGEVRMCPQTAAKIRLLQAEISRLETENDRLEKGNETLAARVRQPFISDSDDSDSSSDSSSSTSSTSNSSSSSSTSSSSGSSSRPRSRWSSQSAETRCMMDVDPLPLHCHTTSHKSSVSAPCSPHVDHFSLLHQHRRLKRSVSI